MKDRYVLSVLQKAYQFRVLCLKNDSFLLMETVHNTIKLLKKNSPVAGSGTLTLPSLKVTGN